MLVLYLPQNGSPKCLDHRRLVLELNRVFFFFFYVLVEKALLLLCCSKIKHSFALK